MELTKEEQKWADAARELATQPESMTTLAFGYAEKLELLQEENINNLKELGRYACVIELLHEIEAESSHKILKAKIIALQAFSNPIIKELARLEADLSGDDRTLFEKDKELN